MDEELDRRLRDVGTRIPKPSEAATVGARNVVVASGPRKGRDGIRKGPRLRRRAVLASAAIVVAITGAFLSGLAVAATPEGQAARIEGPGFLPAPGWDVFQTGTTEPPQAPTATTSTVPLDPSDEVGGLPHPTLERLGPQDVVIFATFYPAGESEAVDSQFPERSLPFRLDDAKEGGIEGQPENVTARRMLGRAGAYNVDVIIFFGSPNPSSSTLDHADDELGRLVVPT